MNFATPAAFWWAVLAVPIVVFYILKIRMRRIPVSTIMFWQQVFEEKQPRSLWQTLRHWLSLLLQLLFLLLLMTALTDPFFASEERNRRRLVLVIDNSASMQARDVSPSRFEAAMTDARRIIDSIRVNDEMAIITAGTQPKVMVGLTGHQKTLREALLRVRPTDGPTEVPAAVALGRRLLTGHENASVVVFTDGCFAKAAELSSGEDVVWKTFGTAAGNVGITQFQVRRSLQDPLGFQVFIEVANDSDADVSTRLELELGGELLDVIPVEVAAGETWIKVMDHTAEEGGQLVATLDNEDALPSDNRAVAILPARARIPVVLVTTGHRFLERVFMANPLVDLRVVATPPDELEPGAVLVLYRDVPETVPAGSVLVIEPTTESELWEIGDVLEQPIVTDQDSEDPLMGHVRLENVLMPEARKITPKGEFRTLVSSASEDPLYLSIARAGGDVLVLTVNIDKGDLPLRTAFPILMTNALNWFTGDKGELREAIPAGALAKVNLSSIVRGAGADEAEPDSTADVENGLTTAGRDSERTELTLTSPDGGESTVIASGDEATIGPLNQCGVWTLRNARTARSLADAVSGDATDQLEVACNLTNPQESNLRAPTIEAASGKQLTAGVGGKPIWFYLTIVAWALVASEWYLYQRRWIT